MNRQHFGVVQHADITNLEQLFATFTADGWVLPPWLIWLRQQTEQR